MLFDFGTDLESNLDIIFSTQETVSAKSDAVDDFVNRVGQIFGDFYGYREVT